MEFIRLIGLPGSGKTSQLINKIEELLDIYSIDEIAYSTFTNAAVNETRSRMQKKFNLSMVDLKWFRTMHSMCMNLDYPKGLLIDEMMHDIILDEFKNTHCTPTIDLIINNNSNSRTEDSEFELQILSVGNMVKNHGKWLTDILRYMMINHPSIEISRKKYVTRLHKLFNLLSIDDEYIHGLVDDVIKFRNYFTEFKKKNKLYDYDNLIYNIYKKKIDHPAKVLLIDEYQDINYLQHSVIKMWSRTMEIIIIAGDPNQSIYSYSGSSPKYMFGFKASEEILRTSYRLPEKIVKYAKKIIPDNKYVSAMITATGRIGEIEYLEFKNIDLLTEIRKYSSVYILCRTSSIKKEIENYLDSNNILMNSEEARLIREVAKVTSLILNNQSIHYKHVEFIFHKHDKYGRRFIKDKYRRKIMPWIENCRYRMKNIPEYTSTDVISDLLNFDVIFKMSQCLPTSLQEEFLEIDFEKDNNFADPTEIIKVMTIHASKGREADLVILLNVASYYENQSSPEEERRVYYVGATRAKEKLIIASYEKKGFKLSKYLPLE